MFIIIHTVHVYMCIYKQFMYIYMYIQYIRVIYILYLVYRGKVRTMLPGVGGKMLMIYKNVRARAWRLSVRCARSSSSML
jgi:hypothetical protein